MPRLRALLALVITWLAVLGASVARAQDPDDVGGGWSGVGSTVTLPAPPEDFGTDARGSVRWIFPLAASDEARELQDAFDARWTTITSELGDDLDGPLEIRIGRSPEEMAALAPADHPPPAYASGVAYPRFGLVLLTLSAPETWERPNLETVLAHELSHVALHRAVRGRHLPRWFVEGVALYQSGEASFERTRVLWQASVAGSIVPLRELDVSFPDRPHEVNLAYAEAADVVAFLRSEDRSGARMRSLIARVSRGASFRRALEGAYDRTLPGLEREWMARLDERFTALPLLVTGGALWGFACVLLTWAFVKRRRRMRATLAQWAEEEAESDRLENAATERLAAIERAEAEAVVVVEPPSVPEAGVPTVEHDGRSHTLH